MQDIADSCYQGLMTALSLMLVMTLLIAIVRREWLASALVWAAVMLLSLIGSEHFAIDIWFAAADAAILIFCVTRLGLLATVTFFVANGMVGSRRSQPTFPSGTPPMRTAALLRRHRRPAGLRISHGNSGKELVLR